MSELHDRGEPFSMHGVDPEAAVVGIPWDGSWDELEAPGGALRALRRTSEA